MKGLPSPIERALRSSVFEYSKDRSQFLKKFEGQYDEEFSVTDLNKSPKQLWLARYFREDIQIDLVRDNYFSLLGSIVHFILEHYAPHDLVVEERQHVILKINGVRVLFHGKPDLYDPAAQHIDDYKFTSAYAILYDKKDYEFQLNANAYLFRSRGLKVRSIRNVYMFRHLDPIALLRNPDYPKENIHLKSYKPWENSVIEKEVKDRIAKHLDYKDTSWKKLPDCTDDERWIRGSSFAILKRKKGTKKQPIQDWGQNAHARFDSREEADKFMHKYKGVEEIKLEYRPAEPKRCISFCPVAGWCKQRQDELQAKAPKVLSV
jgi:hypothetical protein